MVNNDDDKRGMIIKPTEEIINVKIFYAIYVKNTNNIKM
jgi:hypothetical protein